MLKTIESLKNFMSVLDDLHDGAILCDSNMNIKAANKMAHSIFGYEADELIKSNINILIPENIRKQHGSYTARFQKNPEPRTMNMMTHLTGQKKDNSQVHLSISLKPVSIGEESLILVAIRDVEDIVQLKTKLFHAQKMETIGKTCSGIVHDLKNILQIISASSFLARTGDEQELPELLGEIDCQTQLASDMLRYMLTYLKEGAPEPGPVNLGTLIQSFQPIAIAALPKQTQLSFDIEKGEYQVISTPTAISQLLLNLIVNATDALQEVEKPEVKIKLEAPEHGEIRLTVSDNGHGMDENTKNNAFKSYFTTKKEKGTGLGLATVYGIILDQGGHINIESSPGLGTSFIIKLPEYQAALTGA